MRVNTQASAYKLNGGITVQWFISVWISGHETIVLNSGLGWLNA